MSAKEITVFAPNSVANVGCGYDVLGFALEIYGDTITIQKRHDDQLRIKHIEGADLPIDSDKNVATIAVRALLKHASIDSGFDFTIKKSIPPGSGLGSSASSSVGAVFGVNELLGRPFSTIELVAFAMEGERYASGQLHADNVAPSMLGGFTAVRSCEPLDVFNIPFPQDLLVVLVYPNVVIKTSEAKKIIPDKIPIADAIIQSANMAGLISGLMAGDYDRIGRALTDSIAEPYRQELIPHFNELKDVAMKSGALGFNISGSGPTTFAFTNNPEVAKEVQKKCEGIYKENGIDVLSFISSISNKGARVI